MSAVPPPALYQGSQVAGGPSASPPSLWHDRLWVIGAAALALQGLGMLAWSTELWQRFALTYDYSVYHQAWWLLAHGQLDPFSTVLQLPFWQNNFELMMWPLAIIGLLFPHGPSLLWVQDLSLVGAELVAWNWICREAARLRERPRRFYAGLGLLLLLANPWAWWSISFDFHMESLAVLFAVLAAYDLRAGRRRVWAWVVLTLLCGDAEATGIAGLGLGALLAGRSYWWRGAVLVALGRLGLALDRRSRRQRRQRGGPLPDFPQVGQVKS